MADALPVKADEATPAQGHEMSMELTSGQLVQRVQLIQEVMRKTMAEGIDYGVIPGCKKPSLWQPGAEKLAATFRLAPTYEIKKEWLPEQQRDWNKSNRSGTCKGFIRYEIVCLLVHGPTGQPVAGGVGVANNWEPKFISRDPYEVEETILQFARKRALVNAVRTGTAASAVFTQDVEDQPGFAGETRAGAKTGASSGGGEGARRPEAPIAPPAAAQPSDTGDVTVLKVHEDEHGAMSSVTFGGLYCYSKTRDGNGVKLGPPGLDGADVAWLNFKKRDGSLTGLVCDLEWKETGRAKLPAWMLEGKWAKDPMAGVWKSLRDAGTTAEPDDHADGAEGEPEPTPPADYDPDETNDLLDDEIPF